MTYSLPLRYFAGLLLLGAVLLSSCCANDVCDCHDEQADAITLRFAISPDTAAGGHSFGTLQLDTIIVQRTPLPYNARTRPETVVLLRTPAQRRDSIVLNNNTPFTQAGTAKLDTYRYVVQYLAQVPGSRPVPTTALVIDKVQLDGRFNGDGCCTCYQNTQKIVFLDGGATGRDLSADNRVTIARP